MKHYLKNNKAKRAKGMVQVVAHLSHKHKALSSNPGTTKKERKKNSGKIISHKNRKVPFQEESDQLWQLYHKKISKALILGL
jgi:hypothetical protein